MDNLAHLHLLQVSQPYSGCCSCSLALFCTHGKFLCHTYACSCGGHTLSNNVCLSLGSSVLFYILGFSHVYPYASHKLKLLLSFAISLFFQKLPSPLLVVSHLLLVKNSIFFLFESLTWLLSLDQNLTDTSTEVSCSLHQIC